MKTLKLTGNFEIGQRLVDACAEVEAAKEALKHAEESTVEDQQEAAERLSLAQAEHYKILKELTPMSRKVGGGECCT